MAKQENKNTKGKYQDKNVYLEAILKKFKEEYPSTPIDRFTVNNVINMFWDYVEEQLIKEEVVSVWGFGKFRMKQKYPKRKWKDGEKKQWFPAFEWNRRTIGRIRIAKGTASPAELKEHEDSQKFMRRNWEYRYLYMYKKHGGIPPQNLQNLYDLAEERQDASYLDILKKIEILSDKYAGDLSDVTMNEVDAIDLSNAPNYMEQ